VHLQDFPEKGKADKELEDSMDEARKIIEAGRKIRNLNKIKTRQPLERAITTKELKEFQEIVKQELNVKRLEFNDNFEEFTAEPFAYEEFEPENYTILDLTITPELKAEGIVNELSRRIQQRRKEEKLTVNQKVKKVIVEGLKEWDSIQPFLKELTEKVRTESIETGIANANEEDFEGEKIKIEIVK
jgi:valyl-tRNA synthetase